MRNGSGGKRNSLSRSRKKEFAAPMQCFARKKDQRFQVPCIQAKFIDQNMFMAKTNSISGSNKAQMDIKQRSSAGGDKSGFNVSHPMPITENNPYEATISNVSSQLISENLLV
jgi:hypothetical protein